MRKKTGIVFVILGAVLLIAALLSAFYNSRRDIRAGESSDMILGELRGAIIARSHESCEASSVDITANGSEEISENEESTEAMPQEDPEPIKVNGHDCIGYIEIPALEMALPVLSDWSDEKLDIAPCRHFGNAVTDDLVIAGHNFKRHFSYLSKLKGGEAVMFTDTAGVTHYYTVTSVRHVSSDDVEAVKESGHALVLYTCTFIGDIRTAVFCDRAK